MTGFKCPHNEGVHVQQKCKITECPYHMSKVKELFNLEEGETDCSFYDSDIMQNVSVNRTQISALSRDPRRRLSPKLMRSTYDTAVDQAKTLHSLTHSVTASSNCCRSCGYPNKNLQCTSTDLCKSRREWVKFICSQYGIDSSITKFQIIWNLLFKNEIETSDAAMRTGLSLCNVKDVEDIPDYKAILSTL